MKVLGNKITLHSPSRGFSMELGAAITVVLASQYGIPVSTTVRLCSSLNSGRCSVGDADQVCISFLPDVHHRRYYRCRALQRRPSLGQLACHRLDLLRVSPKPQKHVVLCSARPADGSFRSPRRLFHLPASSRLVLHSLAGLCVLSWVITVPVVGTLAGCLMGIVLNAPHF